MELNYYIDSEYFMGTIPTNLEAPKLPDFSIPVKYSTGSSGAEFGISMKTISLTMDKVAFVDDADFDEINRFKWWTAKCKYGTFYAGRTVKLDGKRSTQFMHSLLLPNKKGFRVDHINRDGLDNQRTNLRYCTQQQNCFNSKSSSGISKYKGVAWNKTAKRWRAYIKFDRRQFHLGHFLDEKEAAVAYDIAAIKYFGRFAYTNKDAGLLI